MRKTFVLVLPLLLIAAVAQAKVVRYQPTILAAPPEYTLHPMDVNNKGQVVGGYVDTYRRERGFLWERRAGSPAMTTIQWPVGLYSAAYAINDGGQVAGEAFVEPGACHAFIWKEGVMTDLGTLLPDGGHSGARDINNLGQVTGYSGGRAVMWKDGAILDLGAPSSRQSVGRAINDRGQIVGEMGADTGDHGFLWQDGMVTDLGTLPGVPWSFATDINNAGTIVGFATRNQSPMTLYDCVWQDGAISRLTTDTDWNSFCVSVDDRGQILGVDGNGAYIWQSGTKTYLNDLIRHESGLQFAAPRAMNDLGQVVGDAWYPGEWRQFGVLLTPEIEARIDIKPNTSPNVLNPRSAATVEVAVFGEPALDVTLIDPATVRLGGAQVKQTNNGRWHASFRDVDHDGQMDVIFDFSARDLRLTAEIKQLTLDGWGYYEGLHLTGADSVVCTR